MMKPSVRGVLRRLRGAENWSVLIAAATLLAGLIFNGWQLMENASAQRESRLASELNLLTRLQRTMNQDVYSRGVYESQFRELRAGTRRDLTHIAYRAAAEEAATMEYVAWLFNNDHVSVSDADELWGPLMSCEFRRTFLPGLQDPTQDLPELIEFLQERGRRLSELAEGC